MIHGVEVYRMYLAMKLHFTNPKFDFFQYNGQVNAKEETYQQRNDFWFFETIARKHTKEEIQEILLASFVISEDTTKVWIGDIRTSGKDRWLVWKKLQESISYTFKQDIGSIHNDMVASGNTFNDLFKTMGGHPSLLRHYLKRRVNIETLIIFDIVLGYMKQWDKEMSDPLWENISLRIKKYKPFLSIDKTKYQQMIKEKFCD